MGDMRGWRDYLTDVKSLKHRKETNMTEKWIEIYVDDVKVKEFKDCDTELTRATINEEVKNKKEMYKNIEDRSIRVVLKTNTGLKKEIYSSMISEKDTKEIEYKGDE